MTDQTIPPFRIGVISDTHGLLKPEVFDIFEGVDLIIHAGDVGNDDLLTELEALAPVEAVSGNVDGFALPNRRSLSLRLETSAGRIAVTHGHLDEAPSTDLDRMKAYFDDFAPDIIVYGHSHIAKPEKLAGVRFFNPGAAGAARFGRPPTVGIITAVPGREPTIEHKALTQKAPV